jgi:uncharacterized membrane protein YkvI
MRTIQFIFAWMFFIVGAVFLGIGQNISAPAYDQFVELVLADLLAKK